MIKNKRQAGFTLVELMTVIMIIAVLASVVLVSLDTARKRARDSAIQTQLAQIRSLAETVHDLSNGYEDFHKLINDTTHSEHNNYVRAKESIESVGVDVTNASDYDVRFAEQFDGESGYHDYCMYVRLVRNEDEVFCVDSRGIAEVIDADANSIKCMDFTKEPNCEHEAGAII